MNFLKLCQDFTVPFEQKSTRWINVKCPFCPDVGMRLGYHIGKDYFNCFRCGGKRLYPTIQKLLQCKEREVRGIVLKYGGTKHQEAPKSKVVAKIRSSVKFPKGCVPLKAMHKHYLKGRDFDWEKLVKEWGLQGVGPFGEYKFRIIIPILFKGKMVNWQARDVTDLQTPKYLACPDDMAVMNIKETLYGLDKVKGGTVVIVEGVTDVWRLGPGAVATYGTSYTRAQVNLLKGFKRKAVFFDEDAYKSAEVLAETLDLFPGEVIHATCVEGDPGELSNQEAKQIMEELT